jgi:serine/threonine protein kinase
MSGGGEKRPDHAPFKAGKMIGRFRIQKQIGSGGYGDIYSATDTGSSEPCAVKIEYLDATKKGLSDETKIILKLRGCPFFPGYIAEGVREDFRVLVIDLLGPSLSNMRRILPRHKYTSYSYLRLAIEMVHCIRQFHKRGFIHRDIKPGNFLIRPNRAHPVCLIDFGLSQPYLIGDRRRHVRPSKDAGFTGTCRYASFHAHEDKQLSRRDDMISWFYSVIELAHGHVPWPGSRDRVKTIQMKKEMTTSALCEGLPSPFQDIWHKLKNMKFEEKPPYTWIRKGVQRAIDDLGFREPIGFDWETLSWEQVKEISSIRLEMNGNEGDDEHLSESTTAEDEIGCHVCTVA